MKKWFIENALADMKRVWIKRNFRKGITTFILVLSLSLSLPLLICLFFCFLSRCQKEGKMMTSHHSLSPIRHHSSKRKRKKEKGQPSSFDVIFVLLWFGILTSLRADYDKLAKRNIVSFWPVINYFSDWRHTAHNDLSLYVTRHFLRFSPFVVVLFFFFFYPVHHVQWNSCGWERRHRLLWTRKLHRLFCGATKTRLSCPENLSGWMDGHVTTTTRRFSSSSFSLQNSWLLYVKEKKGSTFWKEFQSTQRSLHNRKVDEGERRV